MHEITILSGKGGTGKTTITAAIASVAKNAVFCDNDVDAADLHLILSPEIKEKHHFAGAYVAEIDETKCTNCGICYNNCNFNAIHQNNNQYQINPFQCEGCRLCERICPSNAITSTQSTNNYWYISDTRFGELVHARMGPGEDNSGKLVSLVRDVAKKIATKKNQEYVINDGPPGIGCTAISSITGTNLVLLVIEPTISGLHDAKRLVDLVQSFNIPIKAVINKYDINIEASLEVESYLNNKNIKLIGKIPFDTSFVKSMIEEKTITEYAPKSAISNMINNIWNDITNEL